MSDSPVKYPERIEIVPLTAPPTATVRVPGSKSITNRALVLAALYSREVDCTLRGCLRSEDTEVMVAALDQLGFEVQTEWDAPDPTLTLNCDVFCCGGGNILASKADLFAANSGTTLRFLTALVSLGQGSYRLDGSPRMRERPIEDLLAALRQLGVRAGSERDNGCPPVIIETDGLRGGVVRIRGNISSQFLSGLLMTAPRARGDVVIEVDGPLVSMPYVAMTVEMMRHWGLHVTMTTQSRFHIPAPQQSRLNAYKIEPDATAASYFWGAAALTRGAIRVLGLNRDSLQGDVRFVEVLEEMGCVVVRSEDGYTVHGGPLHGIDVDMNDISDTVMTLAAVALFADGPTTIRNVAHIRHKETDRLAALAAELRRVGADVDEFADGLRITPRPLHGAEIETYNDHRMAMSMALVGLKVRGVVIKDPGCVAKTYPNFFSDLEKLRDVPSSR
jgi:3-phosphoshikimate 1-carboxyvinyltransferase